MKRRLRNFRPTKPSPEGWGLGVRVWGLGAGYRFEAEGSGIEDGWEMRVCRDSAKASGFG